MASAASTTLDSLPTPTTPPSPTQQHEAPTFSTLPPELRLQIYTHYLTSLLATLPPTLNPTTNPTPMTSTRQLFRLPILNPPLLQTSHLVRNELYPLHHRALISAQEIIHDEREKLEGDLAEGRCFEWDEKEGSFSGGWTGVEMWAVFLRMGVRVQGLEKLEGRLGAWVEGEGSKI